jgi:hypothetical protein
MADFSPIKERSLACRVQRLLAEGPFLWRLLDCLKKCAEKTGLSVISQHHRYYRVHLIRRREGR